LQARRDHVPPAAGVGPSVHEAAPALAVCPAPPSRRHPWAWRASPGAVAAHGRARAAPRAGCRWPHDVWHDDALPDTPRACAAPQRDGGHALGVVARLLSGLWHVEHGTASPRAGHRRWAALQGPERCTGRDLWQRATDGPDLVGLGAAGAPACGSQPAGTRPGAAGDRPALGRDGAARPPGSGPLPGCNRVVAPQHAARAVGDGP